MRWICFFCVAIAGVLGGCHWINEKLNVSSDWVGEQVLEDIIEYKTGISVGFTPGD